MRSISRQDDYSTVWPEVPPELEWLVNYGISAEVNGLCVQSLRATVTTNALSHEADIAKGQDAFM